MAKKYLDENGLLYFWGKLKAAFVSKESGKGLSTNDYTTAEKNKLNGVASGAQVNKIETVKMGGTALTIDTKAVDIPVMTGASASADGAIGVVPKATKGNQAKFLRADGTWQTPTNTNTTYTLSQDSGDGHKITLTPSSGNAQTITIPDNDTTYEEATTEAAGLMSAAMVTKLNGIATGANKTTVDSSLSDTSTNPVQNKIIKGQLDAKAPLASPALTGTPTAPTAAKATNTTQIATTAFVKTVVGDYAPKASPTFTGTPKAPTATAGTNDTQIATTAFVKTAVDNAIKGVTQISYEKVTSLPTTGKTGVIYLLAHTHGTNDIYDEYIWTADSKFEKIGNTDIDLSGYLATTDIEAITNSEIDTIVAA